ncbi:DUF7221 family queuine tRNA-ribosyltransferase-like protein [Croceicoccus gelatinilyticus]|uniref:deazapurine DNA modification protein DpdA family protein n=1 Tax=Croceicoccus gelatinilyticus TaxID=2835536 RepID=UPI001BCF0949|nr:hypothetical protein [Croceicoccus gelatinilyticus]MBS7671431.1 hypothetical protein [Croceicoccus gelatinilyticus]
MRIIVGLPALSRGPLLDTALRLHAPVMLSANALAKWRKEPSGIRLFAGWNTAALDRAHELDVELHLDSAGFVAMALKGGYDWSVESYIEDLCAHPAITRFSSMDLCVEPEIAANRHEVEERLSKTINLNWSCHRIAKDLGIPERLMPVIQGANADDYLRVWDKIAGLVRSGATIGVGSMCRRSASGPDGAIEIIDRLDRELPKDVRLHLFGIKSDAAEAACMFQNRIDSIDSQAYGTRARFLANERRKTDPDFSKSNAFTASVMEQWVRKQRARIASPRSMSIQRELPQGKGKAPAGTILDELEALARSQINDLIESGDLDHDQIVGGRFLEEWVMELAAELVPGADLNTPAKQHLPLAA